MKEKIKVSNISCTNCAQTIKNAIHSEYPELDVKVNVNNSTVFIDGLFDMNNIKYILKGAGYPAEVKEVDNKKTIDKQMIISIIITIPLLLSMFGHFQATSKYIPEIIMNGYIQFALSLFLIIYVGRGFYTSAYLSMKNKVLGMDALIVLGVTTAFLYSSAILFFSNEAHPTLYFEVSAVVLTAMVIGNSLENKVKLKTNQNLSDLLSLSTQEATIIRNGKHEVVDVNELKIGDRVVCLANEKIPIDGKIIRGTSEIDESTFTGESVAVSKTIGDEVLAGTLNISSNFEFEVTKLASETVLSQIIDAVDEASLVETKYQKLADQVASVFVPVIIIIAIFTFIVNYYLSNDINLSLSRSLSVILISCPCALGLATPTSIMVANGIAAKRGILYRGGSFFEIGSKIEVICFDKTGTLTTGHPKLQSYDIKEEALNAVYSVESLSKHPVSKAFIDNFSNQVANQVDNFEVVSGMGIKGIVNNLEVIIGNPAMFKELKINIREYEEEYDKYVTLGYTTNIVAVNQECVGIYGVSDQIKSEALDLISQLKQMNITPVMITGDNPQVANIVAKKLNIRELHSRVLPIDKANIVKQYQDKGKVTAFIGDGINDTVALTTADIGMSVAAGNDIAINASDVSFMYDDLYMIIDGIKISKATRKNIYENLFWAFSYNIIAVPLAAAGYLNMLVAAFAMGFSSIVVVLNALRLNRLKLSKDDK